MEMKTEGGEGRLSLKLTRVAAVWVTALLPMAHKLHGGRTQEGISSGRLAI